MQESLGTSILSPDGQDVSELILYIIGQSLLPEMLWFAIGEYG